MSLRIRILGSGNAFNPQGRGSAGLWAEAAVGGPFLVDVGPTTLAAMQRLGLATSRLDRLCLTHLHGDHMAGWPFLLLHMVFRDQRERPFEVWGPPGTEATLCRLSRLCFGELTERARFELRFRELEPEPRSLELAPGLSLDVEPLVHHPSSIGLRFDAGGKRWAVSGDTEWCDGLERLARGCELLFLECTSVGERVEGHLSLERIRERRDRLEARTCVLVHLDDAVARDLARSPLRGTIAATDGLEVVP